MNAVFNRHHKDAPADAVYIGRPSPWSNPWPIDKRASDAKAERARVIELHRAWVARQPFYRLAAASELKDAALECFCAPAPCHGHTWLKIVQESVQEPVFVFGSNTRGRHGAGAALYATQRHGAQEGVSEGMTGSAYALPTRTFDPRGALWTLPIEAIQEAVERFMAFARSRPDLLFRLTRVGCGLAGHADNLVAPLFFDAPENVMLPGTWENRRKPCVRLIIAGSRSLEHLGPESKDRILERIDGLLRIMDLDTLQIVSGCAAGGDRIGEDWCISRGVLRNGDGLARFPAQWRAYGKAAGHIRNRLMAWYGTHLIALWDESSPGTKAMIEAAQGDGLPVRIIRMPS